MNDPFKSSAGGSQPVPHWYVVQCRVGKEPQVAGIINGSLEATAYVPVVRRARRLGARDVALFPGYLFVCADLYEIRLSSLNATPGVVRLLGVENQPQRI